MIPRTAGVAADYPFIIGSMWLIDPINVVLQGVLLVLVWGHLGIGVYAWLRHRPWFAAWAPYLLSAAVVLPLLALAGVARSVATVDALAARPGWFDAAKERAFENADGDRAGTLADLPPTILGGLLALLAAVLAARAVRHWYRTRHGRVRIQYAGGRTVIVQLLLPPDVTARDARRPGGLEGHEQRVAILFIDLRGSTRLGEKRLPYDVVYVLNRFFAEMADALAVTKGHYAQFNGDGLMALYGLEQEFDQGCRHAIEGAAEMLRRVDALNADMKAELDEPLRVGIGIHGGEAIVGSMGPPDTPIVSAIGDNVNVAARLEALTKEFGCDVVISEIVATAAGVDVARLTRHEAEMRGRAATLPVYAVARREDLRTAGAP